jgi:hypothetical protein
MSSAALVNAFESGEIELAQRNDHYAYSTVEVTSYIGCVLGLVRSTEGIGFDQLADYDGQLEALGTFLDRFEAEPLADTPKMWLYYYDADQPPDSEGNPVREPFFFQVAVVLNNNSYPVVADSPTVGQFAIAQLRALRVATVTYKGSLPHQDNSGFAEARKSLLDQADSVGYRPSGPLYRELYHRIDDDDPSQSITQLQIEIAR